MTDTKQCRNCGGVKPLSAFHQDRSHPDGRKDRCAECVNALNRERYALRRAAPPAPAPLPKWVTLTCGHCGKEMRHRRGDLESRERRGRPMPRFCSVACSNYARRHPTEASA
jgi:hypothetical protein